MLFLRVAAISLLLNCSVVMLLFVQSLLPYIVDNKVMGAESCGPMQRQSLWLGPGAMLGQLDK